MKFQKLLISIQGEGRVCQQGNLCFFLYASHLYQIELRGRLGFRKNRYFCMDDIEVRLWLWREQTKGFMCSHF